MTRQSRWSAAITLFMMAASGVGGSVPAQAATPGSISGVLTAVDGSPAAGVTVEALRFAPMTNSWNRVQTVLSDAQGNYTVPGLEADSYRLHFQEKCPTVRGEYFGGGTYESSPVVPVADGEAVRGKDVRFKGCSFTSLTPPTLSGTAVVGGVLMARPGTWEPSATYNVSYDWLVDGVAVRLGSNSAFEPAKEHVGKNISVRVHVFTSAPGWSNGEATSAAVGPVLAAAVAPTAPVNLTRPKIRGKAQVGRTVKVSKGTWSPASGVTLEYQWLANGKKIKRATKPTFTVSRVVKGKRLQVRVTATVPGAPPRTVMTRATVKVVA